MFFSVITAYVLSAAFAFCGVVGIVSYVMDAQRDMGYTPFIEGLVVTMWPLAVATALVLLTQIACKLERWMLMWTMAQTPATPRQAATLPRSATATPTATPSATPSTTPRAADVPAAVAPPAEPARPTAPAVPVPPASPAPQKNADTIPLPPRPEGVPMPTPEGKQESKKSEALNFFKLD